MEIIEVIPSRPTVLTHGFETTQVQYPSASHLDIQLAISTLVAQSRVTHVWTRLLWLANAAAVVFLRARREVRSVDLLARPADSTRDLDTNSSARRYDDRARSAGHG